MRDAWALTAAELSAAYATGAVTPEGALQSVLNRIEAVNPELNAVVTLDLSGARAAATAAGARWRAGQPLGPLDGIPLTVKDNLFVCGLRATWGSALFADGAAAVVAVGERRGLQESMTGPDVLATRSRMYPESLDIMGWEVGSSGFRLVLSPDLPDLIERYFADDVAAFLAENDLTIDDIGSWVSHPGGPKVLESISAALGISDDALELSWRSLSEIGNLSSASVLHILRDARAKPPASGTPGLLMAMGPGFCAELVLLRWH